MKTCRSSFRARAGVALLFAIAASLAGVAAAQESTITIHGTVRTAAGSPLAAAVVSAENGAKTTTDEAGRFALTLARGRHDLRVTHPTYVPARKTLNVEGRLDNVDLVLEPLARFTENVVVAAVRADAEAPITKRDLDRQEIESLNSGQEMPYLLKQVPSLTQYSDAGSPTGYSYLYLRGIPQTRMNITFDGAPLSEPEDSAFYFSNFGDFANAVQSIQVQRGVGTSTVGTASFVGSINFASIDLKDKPEADIRMSSGSFGTNHVSAAGQSGRLGGGFKLYGQAAYQDSNGFREHSGVNQQSVYAGATRDSDASFFKVFGFLGHERTNLAFLAADEDTLKQDRRVNPLGPDERDDFVQGFVNAQYHRALGPSAELSIQGYYNGAGGWYRLRDASIGLLQYGLDWRNLGAMATFHATRNGLDFSWGAHVSTFESQHNRDIVGGLHEYTNHGFKNEINSFAKVISTKGRWHHYADLQVRWARFRYDGVAPLGSVGWTFFNPKIGTRVDLGHGASLYGSVGRAGREPGRSDMLQGEDNASVPYDLRAVLPERVVNVESGVGFSRPGFTAQINAYFMEFRHEIAQTGELSEIGLPLRRNVDRSFRRGVEIDLTWRPWSSLRLRHTATYSYNRIRTWTQFYDIYDTAGTWLTTTSLAHTNVTPLLTPSVLASASADYSPASWLTVSGAGRYVGQSHLDNTGNPAFVAKGFFGLDAVASINLARVLGFAARTAPRLRIQMDNVLDNRNMLPSGYSYLFFTEGAAGRLEPGGTRYYYPLATRSIMVMLDLKL
ncbi:MAG: TonB-dependent receptor [Acidobacteria bacterium]|nr:TonB-dependent receptor [Acidobacteriota bacterium]